MNEVICEQGAVRLTVRLIAVSAVMLFAAMLQANAQSAYNGDSGHYLQVPNGYAQAPQQTAAGRPIFGGQGMGQGQSQMQQASLQPLTITNSPAPMQAMPQTAAAAPSTVSKSLLPPEMAGQSQAAVQPMPMQQSMLKPQVQQAAQAQPLTTTVAPARMQAAATPSVSPQMLASMEPASGPTVVDSGINVQMRGPCGDGTPDNHRQAKGLNTSTTVFNDCLN